MRVPGWTEKDATSAGPIAADSRTESFRSGAASDDVASLRAHAASLAAVNARLEAELTLARASAALSESRRARADGRRVEAEDNQASADDRSAIAHGDRASAEAATRQALFLAEVGRVLAQSSEYQITLDAVARLAVPVLSDYCAVDLRDRDNVLRRLAVAHVDPAKAPLVERLHAQFPDDVGAAYGSGDVMRSGQTELIADVLARVAPGVDRSDGATRADHVALVEALGLVSSIIVPLVVDGDAVGALTFGSSTSGRRFGALDVLVAEDVGRRASAAIAAAELLRSVRQANARLETQAEELEASQLTLREQGAALETANDKFRAANDNLHAANAALAATTGRAEQAQGAAEQATAVAERAQAVAQHATAAADSATEAAEAATKKALFLAEVGRILSQSSEYQITLDAVARLAVPVLGDYCAVDLRDREGVLRRLAVAHVDPAKSPLVERLHAQFPDDVGAAYGSSDVMRSGRTELVVDVLARVAPTVNRDDPPTLIAQRAEHVALIEALGLVSSIIVPLVVEGRAVGALTVGSSTSGRRFGAVDVLLAEDVGRRASSALAAAELLRDVRVANTRLEDQAVVLESQRAKLQEQQERLHEQFTTLERTTARAELAQAIAEQATVTADTATAAADTARREADNANLAKSQFLASMSHELRTPLNAILGYRQLLEAEIKGPLTQGQREFLARLGRAQEHLLTLINDVLQFAKLEAGQTRIVLADVPVRDVCLRLEELVRPQFDLKKVEYHCATSAEPLASMVAHVDPERLLQILINLVTNAGKFTSAGGTVSLTGDDSGPLLQLHVTDSGMGIAADQLAVVFEPFVQVDRTRSSREGVGLGLAIARELARQMGGDITAASTPSVGSVFTVTVPRASNGPAA